MLMQYRGLEKKVCEILIFRVPSDPGICLRKMDTVGVHPGLHVNAIPGPGKNDMRNFLISRIIRPRYLLTQNRGKKTFRFF
jgi:hypothetical protein